ncbi:hypothetical protein [Microcoleus anatoxicus]
MPILQEIHSLWNRPESLLLRMVQDVILNEPRRREEREERKEKRVLGLI